MVKKGQKLKPENFTFHRTELNDSFCGTKTQLQGVQKRRERGKMNMRK